MTTEQLVTRVTELVAAAPKAPKIPPRSQESFDVDYWQRRIRFADTLELRQFCARQVRAARRRRGDFELADQLKREHLDNPGERHDG